MRTIRIQVSEEDAKAFVKGRHYEWSRSWPYSRPGTYEVREDELKQWRQAVLKEKKSAGLFPTLDQSSSLYGSLIRLLGVKATKKVDVIEVIQKMHDDHEDRYHSSPLFIHFSDLQKVGINPTQSYQTTPLGIYAYPLTREIMRQLKTGTIPFRADAKYLHVLKPIVGDDDTSLPELSQRIDDDEYERLANDLLDIWDEQNPDESDEDRDAYWESLMARQRPIYADVYLEAQQLAGQDIKTWAHMLRRLGFHGFMDLNGRGYIHPSEPQQAVFFSIKAFKVLDVFKNPILRQKDVEAEIKDLGPSIEYSPDTKEYERVYSSINPTKTVAIIMGKKKWDDDVSSFMQIRNAIDVLPKNDLRRLLDHPSAVVVETAAKVAVGKKWLDILADDRIVLHASKKVRNQAATYGSDMTKQRLMNDADVEVRRMVALTMEDPMMLEIMKNDSDSSVRRAANGRRMRFGD